MSQEMCWEDLGDVWAGRPTLGPMTTVLFYRLLQYSVIQALVDQFGEESAERVMKQAGRLAGEAVYRQFLTGCIELNTLLHEVARFFQAHSAGMPRVLEIDERGPRFVFTVLENLDCSTTATGGYIKCRFRQGLIEGILSSFLKRPVEVDEIECRRRGQPGCRHHAHLKKLAEAPALG